MFLEIVNLLRYFHLETMYFNNGSSEIPNRYVLLNRSGKRFQRRSIRVLHQKFIRSFKRQMTVYYNILNILGDHAKIQMQLFLW
jgi:hypothetical protein